MEWGGPLAIILELMLTQAKLGRYLRLGLEKLLKGTVFFFKEVGAIRVTERAGVNPSVRKLGKTFGTRCEIKNVSSIRFIRQAIDS